MPSNGSVIPLQYELNEIDQKLVFFRSPWQYVFGHYDLVFRPTEMSRTILESADHTEKEGDMIGAPRRLRHT